jgi:hypothetical protein
MKNFVSRKHRDAATVRLYRCATTAAMMVVLAESLGAGKKWG